MIRELSIYIESIEEVFSGSNFSGSTGISYIKFFFGDVIFLIGRILKQNMLRTEVFSIEMAGNQLNLIELLEEKFSKSKVFKVQSFEDFIPLKNLLSLVLQDEKVYLQQLEQS